MLPLVSPLCLLPRVMPCPALLCSASPGQCGDQQHRLKVTLPGLKTGSEKLTNSSKPQLPHLQNMLVLTSESSSEVKTE